MIEVAALLDQHVCHAIGDHDRTEWLIAGSDRLGQSHEVRREGKVLATEPSAGTAKAADHLIGDQEDVVVSTDSFDFGPVRGRRNDHATSALQWLADERGDILRP